ALAIIGGLFVLEAVSVIVQVVSFKLTGKRVFRMAPIHHHFEQLGWTEPQIVIRFWIVSVVLALAGLSTLKLRWRQCGIAICAWTAILLPSSRFWRGSSTWHLARNTFRVGGQVVRA